jgi:hypothetical protein
MKKYHTQLFEMANISPERSGIITGIIQIRPEARHSLFPHIHYVHNIRLQNKEYVKFSISNKRKNIEIIEQKNINLTIDEIEDIETFIIKNNKLLKEYYIQAEFILDTVTFLSSIEKI